MLEIKNIQKDYGNNTAIKNINLNIENEVIALLAPNGGGKSTLIKIIASLINESKGEILYNGINIKSQGKNYRNILGYLPQDFGFYPDYSLYEFLNYISALKNIDKDIRKEKILKLIEEVGLEEVKDKKLKKFSKGMIQRVGIAQALLNDPEILILDEPTAGLDPKERVRFRNMISKYSKDKIVILSTHIVSDIENIADRIVFIKNKELEKVGTKEELLEEIKGKVYEKELSIEEAQSFSKNHLVISENLKSNKITVRYIGEKEDSLAVEANLEDLYFNIYGDL